MWVGEFTYNLLLRRRRVVLISIVVALLAALLSVYHVGFSGIHARSLSMAAASTEVLVDSPNHVLSNLSDGQAALTQLAESATLVGNLMTSQAVIDGIAERMKVPATQIRMEAPATNQFTQSINTANNVRKTRDLFSSNDQYRVDIQANPTVPILDISTEAGTTFRAKRLADASVGALKRYLQTSGGTTAGRKGPVVITQLGKAQGGAVTGGLRVEVLLLVLLIAFVVCLTIGCGIARIAEGWRLSATGTARRPPSSQQL